MAYSKELNEAVDSLIAVGNYDRKLIHFTLDTFRESDRGALLIVSAHVEDLLATLLRAAFAHDAEALLGSPDAPLGTFRAKILAAHALGILPTYLRDNIDQLRKARNHCAHNISEVTFADAKIEAHIANIRLTPDRVEAVGELERDARQRCMSKLSSLSGAVLAWVRSAVPLLSHCATRGAVRQLYEDQAQQGGYLSDPTFAF